MQTEIFAVIDSGNVKFVTALYVQDCGAYRSPNGPGSVITLYIYTHTKNIQFLKVNLKMLNFERSRNLVSVNRQKTVILKVGLNKYVFNVVHSVGTLNVMC